MKVIANKTQTFGVAYMLQCVRMESIFCFNAFLVCILQKLKKKGQGEELGDLLWRQGSNFTCYTFRSGPKCYYQIRYDDKNYLKHATQVLWNSLIFLFLK